MNGTRVTAEVALWIIVGFQTVVLVELVRQIGILRRRLGIERGALVIDSALERGSQAPVFTARELHSGEPYDLDALAGERALMVFISPRCQTCRTLIPGLPQFAREHRSRARMVTVCSGPEDECRALVSPYKLAPVLADPDQSLSKTFKIVATPAATLIDAEGRVRLQAIPGDIHQLEMMLDEQGTPGHDKLWTLASHGGDPANPPAS